MPVDYRIEPISVGEYNALGYLLLLPEDKQSEIEIIIEHVFTDAGSMNFDDLEDEEQLKVAYDLFQRNNDFKWAGA